MTNSRQTNAELIDYKFEIMHSELQAIREESRLDIQKLHDKMDKFIEASAKMYVTRDEHNENKKALEELKKDQKSVMTWSITWLGSIVLAWIIWIIDIILKKIHVW